MISVQSLDAMNRARAARPMVLVLTRRRSPACEAALQAVSEAARDARVDAFSLDVDDGANATFLHDIGSSCVPEMLVYAGGVVLERTGVRHTDDARALLRAALPRAHR